MAIRSLLERKRDTLEKLQTLKDVWVASASGDGRAHLVPFSLDWDGEHIIVATETTSRTAQNIRTSLQARLAIGDTRDVVIIDVHAAEALASEAAKNLGDHFLERTAWDPREQPTDWVYFVMTLKTVQAWKSEAELDGRTIMRQGEWLNG